MFKKLFVKCFRLGVLYGQLLALAYGAVMCFPDLTMLPFVMLYGCVIGLVGGVTCGAVHGVLVENHTRTLVRRGISARTYVNLICAHSIPSAIVIFAAAMQLELGPVTSLAASAAYGTTVLLACRQATMWFANEYSEYLA